MSVTADGDDGMPDRGEEAENSDSESSGSHDSASNEENGDESFCLRREENNEEMNTEPTKDWAQESSVSRNNDISELQIKSSDCAEAVVASTNDEVFETVEKMDCSPATTGNERNSEMIGIDCQDVEKNNNSKDDDGERSITSIASTVTIVAARGDVENAHFAENTPGSNEDSKKEGCENSLDSGTKLADELLDDGVTLKSHLSVSQRNENDPILIDLNKNAQNSGFEQRRRCHSDAVAELDKNCAEEISTESKSVVAHKDKPCLMPPKRRNSMGDIGSCVPQCKKQEIDLLDKEKKSSSVRRVNSLKVRSSGAINGSNAFEEADDVKPDQNFMNKEHILTKNSELVFKKAIVSLDRLNLDGRNLSDSFAIAVSSGKGENVQSVSKSDTDHCVGESLSERNCENVVHHNNTISDTIDATNFWDWSFQVSSNIDKFRKNNDELFLGLGTYLKSRKNKIGPPHFNFFRAETKMNTANSQMACSVKFPFSEYEEHEFFYSFFCIAHSDEPMQKFENLIASATSEHDKIYNAKFEKRKDWGVLEFKRCANKTDVEEKSHDNSSKKKRKQKPSIPETKSEKNEDISVEEEVLKVKDVVGNKSIDYIESANGNQMILNAIFGRDILNLGCRWLLICVATSLDKFKKLRPGWIVSSFENSIWLRFHIPSIQGHGHVEYKYCVVENLNYNQDRCYEILHEDGLINRVLQAIDFRESVEKVKFDGHVKFGDRKGEHKRGIFDKIKSAMPKWLITKKEELNFYETQNLEAFEHYALELSRSFTETLDINWMWTQWIALLRTLTFVRWGEGSKTKKESIGSKIFLEPTLKCFYSLYSEYFEPSVGECERFEGLMFKLSTIIFISAHRTTVEKLDTAQWEKHESWLMFPDEKTLGRFSEELLLKVSKNDQFFDFLRDKCQWILTIGSENNLKFSSRFYVFFEWALLNNGSMFLKIPPDLRLRKDSIECIESSYTSTATNKHLLIMAILSNSSLTFFKDLKWLTSDILSCLYEVWLSRQVLPETFLHYLNDHMLSEDSSWDEINLSLNLTYLIKDSIIKSARFLLYKDNKFFINRFLHFSLDLLAIVDSKMEQELPQTKTNFYGAIAILLKEVNLKDNLTFTDMEIFYWANLLHHRKGYSQESIDFIEKTVKKQLLSFLLGSYTVQNLIPKFCVYLPDIVKSLNSKGRRVECYKELNNTLEEALIASIFSQVNAYTSDINFLINVDARPLVAEAFCRAVNEKFPPINCHESSFEVVSKNLEHQLLTVVLDFMGKKNPVVQKHFGQQVTTIREAFIDVCCRLDLGDITATQYQTLSQNRQKFTTLCQKLGVFDQNSVSSFFTRMDSVYLTITGKIADTAKLIELTNKFESCDIKIDTSVFEQLHKDWKSHPLNTLVTLEPQSLEFSIVPQFPTLDDIRSVEVYKELMTSQIFSKFAIEMLKASFERTEESAFHYRHFLTVEMKKVHQYYLQQADSVASGRLSVNQAKHLLKCCPNDTSRVKEMELFFMCLQKEAPNPDLRNKLETRKRQLKEIYSLGISVAFMRVLRKLVDMLQIDNLSDNFNQLEKLENLDSFQVCNLTDELLKCNEEFSDVSDAEIKAIDAFVEQPAFLTWIKEKMKTLQELTVVAELASLSAGEIVYDIDRVKFFHDAVFGYAPFIYDLGRDSDFNSVRVAYKKVFSKMNKDKKLPEKYVDSARHQAWFEKALETQGSVEKSSLEKALLINKSGVYNIDYKQTYDKAKVLIAVEDVISLQYMEKTGSANENNEEWKGRSLSLSELRDLLSRLMLIVGREKHDQSQNVDTFITTFQNIERLAAAFVVLFNSGCSFFQNWKAVVRNMPDKNEPSLEVHFGGKELKPLHGFCAETNADLSDLCAVLEAIKLKWQEYVFKMRNKHPVLNRFNVQQLKVISSSLAKSKKTQEPIEERALYFMRSLNSELIALDIQKYLEESSQENEMEVDCRDEEADEPSGVDMLNFGNITEEACVDKRSHLLSLIDKLKEEFNDNEMLAKAAVQATGASPLSAFDNAVNWILDNEDQDENIQYLAEQFNEEFRSLELEECQTDMSVIDYQGVQSARREFSSKLEKLFDGYLLNLRENALPDFMNLHQVGKILSRCIKVQTFGDNESQLQMPPHLKPGGPHLIVCEKRKDLLPHVVSLYRFASRTQLPDYSQVLFCNSRTTINELEVFLLRATLDPECRVYTMAFADDLNANCADHLEKYLLETNVENTNEFKLVVFCCDESSQVSVILEKYKTKLGCEHDDVLRNYICENLQTKTNEIDKYRARLVTSTQPSSGKSLHIDRLEEQMENTNHENRVVLRLYDRKINFEKVLDILWHCRKMENPVILHFDVSSNVLENVDELIFKLCLLGGITDERGKLFVARENFFVAIEMLEPQEKSVWERLCGLLPTTCCLSPIQCLRNQNEMMGLGNRIIAADARILSSDEFQRPNQYLMLVDANQDVTNYRYESHHRADANVVIQTLKNWSGLRNPTWAQLCNFARFLNEQLESCENNVFVNLGEFPGFKNFLLRHCLVKMAQDFALPSLSISDNSPLFGLEEHQTNYEVHQLRRRWESHPHPYVFFNADKSTFTFLGVRVHNAHLLDSNGNILAHNVMAPDLEQQIKRQAYDEPHILGENFDQLPKDQKFTKLCRVLGVENEMRGRNVDSNYELTQDNVMKLLAIHMRFRCDIPVIIMGETGCGKTRLIEYLCLLIGRGRSVQNKKIVKVHGGVTVDDIVRNIEEAEALAKENTQKFGRDFYTVLFFDEANTTEAIYAIKEVVCDFSVNGRKLDPNSGLKVIVACNPYRKHDEKMIKKLESQGLGYHVKSSETEDKLDSDIPMRHLVYRVNPLPPSLLPLVWDFGQLTSQVEDKYIKQIVARHANKFDLNEKDTQFVCDVLSISQKFLRENRDQCLFVSLRDIERAMTVLEFFHSKREKLFSEMDDIEEENMPDDDDEDEAINELARLMILTLGVCYHSSLEDRNRYRIAIARAFKGDYALPHGAKSILKELDLCQQVFVQNLHLDEKANIAKNLALSENVFMMIICIQLRVPLFLVGKPGSSKSLAKTIVIDAMQGGSSRNEFFKLLKQVQMLSFQCSPHTNAEGIMSTFRQAALYQKGKDLAESFVSVVVLDEIGLAEDSPKMPLKTLHPLLEEGYVEDGKRTDFGKVGFVGISNWALDPAKMNRGILVSRTVPKSNELIKSANGICRIMKEGKPLEKLIQPLSDAYEEIYKAQISAGEPEYFGLRDFYGLLKMLHREFVRNGEKPLKWETVQGAIRRNFGEKDDIALRVFVKHLKNVYETCRISSNKVDTLSLVEENIKEANKRAELSEEQRSMDNESRYLLLMTENFSALQLLPQVLNLKDCEVIFGSSFPQDQEYIQVCKNINRIKICMEMGTTVVLLNLGSLYESLYDALNQYYVYYGGKRFVDLGLGSNRVKCSVSERFRLIMIEEEKIALKFPIPLLNRLEKHFLGMESILSLPLKEVRGRVCEMLETFSVVPRQDSSGEFTIRDAFVGYQEDTTACVVMQAKNYGDDLANKHTDDQDMEQGEIDIYKISLENIFQTCTKEAMIRAPPELAEINIDYLWSLYEQQGRRNLHHFLWRQFYLKDIQTAHHLVEVTTFCRIPSHNDIKSVNRELMEMERTLASDERHAVINLNVFETEHEFVERVKDFVRRSKKHRMKKVLFVTCSKGDRFVSLIACVKYALQNLLLEFNDPNLFIIFLVQLPRNWYKSNYSSFSVGKWTSFHIDKLIVEEEIQSMMEVTECQGSTLRDLFVLKSGECSKFQRRLLRDVVYEAVADSRSAGSDKLLKVSNVFRLFEEHHVPSLEIIFLNKAAIFIDNECGDDKELKKWMAEKASNLHELIQNGDVEHALFHELKQRVKPHLAEFLQTIDFNNNVRLLFKNSWCKTLWMELFSLKEISRARILNKRENAFDSLFPFSAEIIAKMDQMWIEAHENCQDQNMEVNEYFIYCFENQENDLWGILRQISLEESALDAFVHDLIYHEFVGISSSIKNDQNKFIRKSILHRMPITENKSLAIAFTVFVNLKPEIAAIARVLRLVSGKKSAPIDVPFKDYVLKTALESLSKDANDLSPTKSDIDKFVQDVQIVNISSESFPDNVTFSLQLQKLSIFATFLKEVCHGLDEELTQQAAGGAKTIWTSIRNEQNLSGSKKLVSRLTFCLKKSLDAVLKVCLRREFGRSDCALCRKDVTGKGVVPFVIPCERNHVAHQKCWDDKIKALENYEAGNLVVDEVKCLLCNEEINRDLLGLFVPREYSCHDENINKLWKQFLENICKVFINLVKDHFMQNCEKDAASEILQMCLFYNEDSQRKISPHYITNQSKQALITIFAQSNPDQLNQVLEELIRDDLATQAFQINCSKTLDLLLAVFDCVISNDGFPSTSKKPPKFVEELQCIVRVKTDLQNLCHKLVEEMKRGRRIDLTIPKSMRDILDGRNKEIRDHLKIFFIRTICLDHGMNYYAQVKEVPALHALIPHILLNSQAGDFTDIFLVIPDYQNTMTEFVKGLTNNAENAISTLERKAPLLKNLVVYRYLLDMGKHEAPNEVVCTVRAMLENRNLNCLGNILDRNDTTSPFNPASHDLEQHFFFLLRAVFSLQQTAGILDPLRNIALKVTNEAQLFLPTFPDSVQRNMAVVDRVVGDFTTWNTCPNGHQYLIGDCGQPNAPGVCPDCGAAIGGGQHRFNPNNQLLGNRGVVPVNNGGQVRGYVEAASNNRNFERNINSFTGSIMRAFLHATLYLKSGNNAMANKLKQNVETISRSVLNVSQDNVWKFLVHILVTASNQQLQGSFQNEDTREQWENAFSVHIVNAQRNLNTILQAYDAAFRQDCRNEFNTLPTVLYGKPFTELPNPQRFDQDLMCLEKFWARTPKVTLVTFAAQIIADKERYPLLSALLDEDVVEALKLIPTFLHVFKEIMKHYHVDESHKVHNIKDFLADLPRNVEESISEGVRYYIKTWNTLIRRRLDTYRSINCLFKDVLTMDAPMKYFLPTRHVSDCAVLVTMNFLISKNNELIEKYRGVCKIETPVLYLEEGNIGEEQVVSVSDVKRNLLPVVVTFTTQDFTNNTPRVVHDFDAIERTVGSRLCAFKPLIRMKIMPLMSKSSSTKSALNNARPHLEEKPLSKTEADRIGRQFTEIPEVCKALRQLVLLMKYLDKDCSKDSSTIADFMKHKLKLDCVPAVGNYELNQTVSLWQHLSLRKTCLMMEHGGEDPYPEILDEFKDELDAAMRDKLGRMKKERKKKLLIMLNEFIVLNLHEPELMKPEYHIETDCLDIYFDEETELRLPEWAKLKYSEDVIKQLILVDTQ